MEKISQLYGIGYLLKDTVSEDAASEEVKKIKSVIEDNKGIILEESRPKHQRLAYPIEKTIETYSGWMQFSTKPEDLLKINQAFVKNKSFLRYLITTQPKQSMKIKPVRIKTKRTETSTVKKEKSIKSEEIDKQLEEILGND